jgi:regulator of RNase E activity RraA
MWSPDRQRQALGGEQRMAEPVVLRADLELLARFDTATVCNALEVLRPECRSAGYTRRPLLAARPDLAPVVGLARVGAIRAAAAPRPGSVPERVSWYDYVAAAELPTIVVIEDRDAEPGTGAFWGEVNSLVHKTLGAAGCVTNGSFRDVTALADGFQILGSHVGPSHAHVHIVEFGGPVEVCGMLVHHDDIVHADYQGAVVIPADCVKGVAEAVALVSRREKVILDACRDPAFSSAKLRAAMARSKEIH